MRKKIIVMTILIFYTVTTAIAISGHGYSWYYKPSNDGKQPEIISEASHFIDKYNTVYMGSPDEKCIYLTFDAGYENGNVEKILDTLKEKNVKAAFFVLPLLSKQNKDLLVRMKEEGHLVCNHTKSHRDMSAVTDLDVFKSELIDAETIFKEATGYDMDKFYRPPEGKFSEMNLKWADELGYTTVFWSLAYADWDNNKQMNPQKALDLISSRTHNGCVALLHPTSATNSTILGDYIDRMRSQGYEFLSLSDFIKAGE